MPIDIQLNYHHALVHRLAIEAGKEYPVVLQNIELRKRRQPIGEIDLICYNGLVWDLFELKVNHSEINERQAAAQLYRLRNILHPLNIRDCYYVSKKPDTRKELVISKIDFNRPTYRLLKHDSTHADITEFLNIERQWESEQYAQEGMMCLMEESPEGIEE